MGKCRWCWAAIIRYRSARSAPSIFHNVITRLPIARLVQVGIVGLDLCEVAPGETEWDANVGARLLYKMICGSGRSRIRIRGTSRTTWLSPSRRITAWGSMVG